MAHASSHAARPVIASITMILAFSSCHNWHVRHDMTIPEIVAEDPDQIRVERIRDVSKVVLHDPQMMGDTLSGLAGHSRSRATMIIPFSDVRSVETRKVDVFGTIVTALGVSLATFVTAVLVILSDLDCYIDCM